MKQLSFTLLEQDNSECPNIGTITGSTEVELREKAIKALESHFDAEIELLKIQDDLTFAHLENSYPHDALVKIDGAEYRIELQQTWIY